MKSFIILGFFIAALSCVAGSEYEKAIIEANETFPGLLVGTPEVLKVVFDNGAFLDLGNIITPTETKNQPLVDWNANEDAYYTLIAVLPDAPSRKDPFLRDYLMWTVGNIPGKNISAADVLIEYISACPPRNGVHRYFYFLYQQPGKLTFKEKLVDKYNPKGRITPSLPHFTDKYNMGHPVAFNYFTAYFDHQSEVVYKQLKNCCKSLL